MNDQPNPESATPTESQTRPKRRRIKFWLIGLGIAYLCWMLLVWAGQNFFIFMGAYHGFDQGATPNDPRVEQVWYEPEPDVRVEGWFLAGKDRTANNPGPAILFFHGNNHVVDSDWRISVPYANAGYSFFAIEYRGYGRATGSPNQEALISDAKWFYDWLVARPEVDAEKIIFHGNSVGGGIAIGISPEKKPAALILESTFYSLKSLFPRLGVPSFLCSQPFRSDLIVGDIDAPMLVVHGNSDWIIPMSQSKKLAAAARDATFAETDAGHRHYEPAWDAIDKFLVAQGYPSINQ
ncbi:MAG: alpha/beta hydrolase [Phycisphaerae bacterium]